jgi:hypothetical protein
LIRVHFIDDGNYDLRWWDVDDKGMVVNSNLQIETWRGFQVRGTVDGKGIAGAKPGDVQMVIPRGAKKALRFFPPIEKVEVIPEAVDKEVS